MLALQLSDQYFYRSGRSQQELDSALYYTTIAQKLAISLRFEKGLAMVYFQQAAIFPLKNLHQKGQHATEAAIKLFAKQKDYRMQGEAYYRLAGYFDLDTQMQERVRYTHLSLDAFRSAKLAVKQGAVLQTLGELYHYSSKNGAALSCLKQSLQAYQSVNYKQLMGVYDLLGSVYTSLGASEESIRYGILALRNAETNGDTSLQLSTIYTRLGITHYRLREYSKAIENYENALRIAEKYGDAETMHIIASNLGSPYLKLKKFKEAAALLSKIEHRYPINDLKKKFWLDRAYIFLYREQGQFERATKYINELLTIAEGLPPDRVEVVYSLLIEFYFVKGNYDLAAKYVALRNQLKLNNNQATYRSHLWQSKLDSVNHRYYSALAEFQKYSLLRDSIFNESKSQQINHLEIIYETEKKEENIAQLKKESALQQNMLEQASLIQNITYISIGLLLVIISLLIYGYRLVQKNNKGMAARQEEINSKNISLGQLLTEKEWLMKEIHHRVKNNLHMIVGLLESQSEYLISDEAKTALADSEYRIQSMSMIHQKLYQTDKLNSIEISPYIHELVQYLKDSFQNKPTVIFNLDIDRVEMNISHSIPLGLILNEAIINSLKYAFPNDRPGKIDISFKERKSSHFVLTIADNGIGLSPDFSMRNIDSFGLTLIQGLSEDLNAEFKIDSKGGTTVWVSFEYISEKTYIEQ
ncbi:tetratricopeptide repeat protein [Dyadobacter sp. CY356]|nr:tetratricopeptide repeat protein [Dyadobacter sp. CY356]